MAKNVKFLEFFRVNRLLQYMVLSMVMPSIAFPAGALSQDLTGNVGRQPVSDWQAGPRILSSEPDARTLFPVTPSRLPGTTSRFNVLNPMRGTVSGSSHSPEDGSSTDSRGSTPPKSDEGSTESLPDALAIIMNPLHKDSSPLKPTRSKAEIRAKFVPSLLKAAGAQALKEGKTELAERLGKAFERLAPKFQGEWEEQKRKDEELKAMDSIPMTPGLQKVSDFMEEVFSQKATRMRKIANWATVLVVCGLCYALYGIEAYFNANVNSVPNSSLSQYFQNEGTDLTNNLALGTKVDFMLIIPYYVYRLKVLVDYVVGQVLMAPLGAKFKRGSKNDFLLAMGFSLTYLATVGLAVLQGMGPANTVYQTYSPFWNTAQLGQTAPVPLGIFMALNFFMVLINPAEEHIIGTMIKKYAGPDNTKKRTEMAERLDQAMKKVYGMEGPRLRQLWAQLQPERGQDLRGIQSLKALFQIVDKKNHTPRESALKSIVSQVRKLGNGSRRQIQAPVTSTASQATESQHASSQKGFKPILKSAGMGMFWLLAMVVSLGPAFLSFHKTIESILDIDRRVKTGQPDLTFYEQTQIGRALDFEQRALASIPGLWNASNDGWEVYDGQSPYTVNVSGSDGMPFIQSVANSTGLPDSCNLCFTGASFSINSALISPHDDPVGDEITFAPSCPWTPSFEGFSINGFGINRYAQLFYNSDNCYGLYDYIQSLYSGIPYSLPPLQNQVLPQSRYFYEWYLTGQNPPVPIATNSTPAYTSTPAMEGFAETMGGLSGTAFFALGIFFFQKFSQYVQDSFATEPQNPMPGKNNLLFNAIEMPVAAAQALFWSADNFFLAWGILNDTSLSLKLLVGGAAVATQFTVWFRTFDEAYVAIAGWAQQGWRNVHGRYHKWRNPAYGRPALPVGVMKERLIRKFRTVKSLIAKMDPNILDEIHDVILGAQSRPLESPPIIP